MLNGSVNIAAALYRAAIWCYPRWFRERYADSLVATFRGFCGREMRRRGVRGVGAVFARSFADSVVGGLAERQAPFCLRQSRHAAAAHEQRQSEAPTPLAGPGAGASLPQRFPSSPRRYMSPLFSLPGQLKVTLRSLCASPLLAITILLTLAMGIGANATMFGIIDRLMLRPPAHLREPESIRRIGARTMIGGEPFTSTVLSYPIMEDLRAATTLAEVAAFGWGSPTLDHGDGAREVTARFASPGLFSLLGVEPYLGRFFDGGDSTPGAGEVAVLGYEFWRGQLGGTSEVLGRTVELSGIAHTVIGVMPPGFSGIDLQRVDVWVPVTSALHGERYLTDRNRSWISIVARLADGASDEAARDEVTALIRGAAGPGSRLAEADSVIAPLRSPGQAGALSDTQVAAWLTGVAAIVLLIACANTTSLLLARGLRRRGEIAVRLALGISRPRLASELLLEALVLALAGGALAVLLAFWTGDLVRSILLPEVFWDQSPVSTRVLLFTLTAALVSALLSAFAPVVHSRRLSVHHTLKSEGTAGSSGRGSGRPALVIAQVALSVLLLAGAGLLTRSLHNVRALDIGFDKGSVAVAIPEYESGAATGIERRELFAITAARLQALPFVTSVATANSAPFTISRGTGIRVPGIEELPHLPSGGPYRHDVSDGYFSTVGLQIERGRAFTAADNADSVPVMIVGATMARLLWPAEDPLGKCVFVLFSEEDQPCFQVVGIVEDGRRDTLFEGDSMQYYLPLPQAGIRPSVLFVRLAGDAPADAPAAMRREFLASSSAYRFVRLQTLEEIVAPEVRAWSLGATVFSGLSALAVIMVVVGLFASLSFQVVERRREIGVRIALGASRRNVVVLMMVRAVRWVMAGLALGVFATIVLGGRIEPLLYGVEPTDATVLAGVCAVLPLLTVAATWLPAWRAGSIDPNVSLRRE